MSSSDDYKIEDLDHETQDNIKAMFSSANLNVEAPSDAPELEQNLQMPAPSGNYSFGVGGDTPNPFARGVGGNTPNPIGGNTPNPFAGGVGGNTPNPFAGGVGGNTPNPFAGGGINNQYPGGSGSGFNQGGTSQFAPNGYGISPNTRPMGPVTMSVLRYQNGDTYRGEVAQVPNSQMILPYGQGVFYYPNGQVFMGTFTWNVANGAGRMQYTNGDVFEGTYNMDVRHGFGRYYSNRGDVVEGYWQNDRFVQLTRHLQPGQYGGQMPQAVISNVPYNNNNYKPLTAPAPSQNTNQYTDLPFMN